MSGINKQIIDKIIDESKINEIMQDYFKIDDIDIKNIYQDVINFFYRVDKTWKFERDLKIFLKDKSDFLMDKILTSYSLWENNLYNLYLSKLWLKKNSLDNSWLFLFYREIFQDWWIEKVYSSMKTLQKNYSTLKNNVVDNLKWFLWSKTIEQIKNEMIYNFKKEFPDLSREDIEKTYSYIIDNLTNNEIINRYKTVIIKKINKFFELNLNVDINFLIKELNNVDKKYMKYDFKENFKTDFLKNDIILKYNANLIEYNKWNKKLKSKLIQYKKQIEKINNNQLQEINKWISNFWKLFQNNIIKTYKKIKTFDEKKFNKFKEKNKRNQWLIKNTNVFIDKIKKDNKILLKMFFSLKVLNNLNKQIKEIKELIKIDIKDEKLINYLSLWKKNKELLTENYLEKEKEKQIYVKINNLVIKFWNSLKNNILFMWNLLENNYEELLNNLDEKISENENYLDEVINSLDHDIKYIKEIINFFDKNLIWYILCVFNETTKSILKKNMKDYLSEKQIDFDINENSKEKFLNIIKKIDFFIIQFEYDKLSKQFWQIDMNEIYNKYIENIFYLPLKYYDKSWIIKQIIFAKTFLDLNLQQNSFTWFFKYYQIIYIYNIIKDNLPYYEKLFVNDKFLKEIKKLEKLNELFFDEKIWLLTLQEYFKEDLIWIKKKYFEIIESKKIWLNDEDKKQMNKFLQKEKKWLELNRSEKKIKQELIEKENYILNPKEIGNLKNIIMFLDYLLNDNILKWLFEYLLSNKKQFETIIRFEKKFKSIEEIDILNSLYMLLNWPNVETEVHSNFILVFVWDTIFTFLQEPTFKVLNEVTLYLSEDDKKNKKHVFLFVHINFFSYITSYFKKKINITWLNQVFSKLMLFSFYNPELSDWTIYWLKNLNIAWIVCRINWAYKNFWIKKWWVIQWTFPYSMIEETINNITMLWWNVSWWKQSDTSIEFGWIKYRLWIWKDWERIAIVARRNWFAWVEVDLFKLMEDEWMMLYVWKQQYNPEQFTLNDTYMEEDVEKLLEYSNQKKWLIIISWQTWSWKSVSMRNLLNHVFEKAQTQGYYRKIWTFENPIEVENPNFMQLEASKEELPKMMLFIKRWDFDDALVWEIRNYEMLPWILESAETISTYTTSHQASVATWFLLLKNWSVQANIDFIDVLNSIKIYLVQWLWKIIKPKYLKEEIKKDLVNQWKIKLIDSDLITKIDNDFYYIFDSYIWKDISLDDIIVNYNMKTNSFKENKFKKELLEKFWKEYIEFLSKIVVARYYFKKFLTKSSEKWLLIMEINESLRWRKAYYEYIDKIWIKSNYQVIYSCYTWDNILKRPLTFEESDPDKLITKIMKHSKEEMWLIDFFKWLIPYEHLREDFNVTNLPWAFLRILEKNKIKSDKDFEWYFKYVIFNN